MPFIKAHLADILIIILLLCIVMAILWYFYKRKKKGQSVGCIGCSHAENCHGGCQSGLGSCPGHGKE